MNTLRRSIVKLVLAASTVTVASLLGVRTAFAAVWNKVMDQGRFELTTKR